jgi:hypothetical protein
VSVLDSVSAALRAAERCDKDRDGNQQEDFLLSKYETEALLTALLAESLSAGECGPEESSNATASVDFLGYCDMGPGRTVIQPDNKYLAMVPPGSSLPCRFYTREGDHVDSIRTLARLVRLQQEKQQREEGSPALESPGSCEWSNAAEDDVCHTSAAPALHLYAVPAGRVFMYAPSFVGERFVLDRMRDSAPSGEPVVLEVLSTNPRVFELHNFYSPDEASRLIQEALSETSESHRFHRSTTGAVNAKVFSKRTSENAWLTHTDLAQTIKRYSSLDPPVRGRLDVARSFSLDDRSASLRLSPFSLDAASSSLDLTRTEKATRMASRLVVHQFSILVLKASPVNGASRRLR